MLLICFLLFIQWLKYALCHNSSEIIFTTLEGIKEHYELGKWLRERYRHLLPSQYLSTDIYVQSTNMDRTIMSAQSNLAGLYFPNPETNWSPKILWTPIPVHTNPQNDSLFYGFSLIGKSICPRYDYLNKEVLQSTSTQNFIKSYSYVFDIVSANSGLKNGNLLDLLLVFDTLEIEDNFGYDLPDWSQLIYPEPLRTIGNFFFSLGASTKEMARLQMGPLVKEILERIKQKITGSLEPDYKMFMYSAHDSTVANFLTALNVYNGIRPPYCSTIMLELRRKNTDHFVMLTYRNSSEGSPFLLTIPGCSAFCPFSVFADLMKPLIPENWEKECQDLNE